MFFIPSTAGQFLGFYETKVIPFFLSKVGGFVRTKWSKKYFWKKNKRSCFLYPQPPVSFWDLVKKKAKKISKLKINFFFFVDTSKTDRRLRVPKVGGFVKKLKKLKISKRVPIKDYVLLTYIWIVQLFSPSESIIAQVDGQFEHIFDLSGRFTT